MNYEKKYRDLVEAIKVLKKANPSDEGIQNWVNDNVPELRESEDEKIRKELICFLETEVVQCSARDKYVAWLEKQGKQKPIEWSQEDEIGLSDTLWCCKQAASIAKDENDMGNCWYAEHWLKSIKERIKGK